MMASPKTVNEAMSKADSLDSAYWLASTMQGAKPSHGFLQKYTGGAGTSGGAGSSGYALMDLGSIVLAALRDAGVQGLL